jgi:hypothetical protein
MNYLFTYNEDYIGVNGVRMVEANSEDEAIRKFIENVIHTDDDFYEYVKGAVFSGDIDIRITDYDKIKKV